VRLPFPVSATTGVPTIRLCRRSRPIQACLFALLLLVMAPVIRADSYTFSIPAQPLSQALTTFAGQAGIDSLIYAQRDLEGLRSTELQGSYSVADALKRLLENTGLSYRQLPGGAFAIVRSGQPKTRRAPPPAPVTKTTRPDTEQSHSQLLEEVVSIGTRVKGRTVTETTVPVDILPGEMIQHIGAAELGERLQLLAPSFNFSRTTVSDGTDFVRPATLRGLSPDQMLVLINGKRRHHQAQLNIQQTVGRGSAGTDINAIPLAAVERVEVLRDGAAAQYGSDAIAGVINIVLKDRSAASEMLVGYGGNKAGDGETGDLSLHHSWGLPAGGYLNVTVSSQQRNSSNRAGRDQRFDPPQVSMKIGDAESDAYSLFWNSALPLEQETAGRGQPELYLFGGLTRREGRSAGFYRGAGAEPGQPPVSGRYVPALFPSGFLPLQVADVDDDALILGYRAPLTDPWAVDASLTYGRNRFTQGSDLSVNVSLGEASPTRANNGYLEFQQVTANLDFNGQLAPPWALALYVAAGVEYRDERYRIKEGDFVAYAYGPSDDFSVFIPSPVDPCPLQPGPQVCADGSARDQAQAGMQAYPGFRESVNASRDSLALYLDLETQLNHRWTLGAAGRFERYDDAGNSTTGKLSFRYQWTDTLALRGALSSGFRAPGLNQRAFTHVLTNVGPEMLRDTLHAAEGSDAVLALGVDDLQEERSRHGSLGLVWQPGSHATVSLDWYRIDIDDRIVMTDVIPTESVECEGPGNCPLAEVLAALNRNIGAVQFFTNAIDTRTQGADLVISRDIDLSGGGQLQINAAVHLNKTEVTLIEAPSTIAPQVLFSPAQVDLLETGQPRQRYTLGLDWQRGPWRAHLQLNRYGKVKTSFFTEAALGIDVPGSDETAIRSDAAWITDLDLSYRFGRGLQLSLGASNLFDQQPDKLSPSSVPAFFTGGSFVYPWESTPFGVKGAYYYSRLQYNF